MIAIKLREAMETYKRRTGRRMTYQILAERTGIGHGTLRIIGSRDDYNATLRLIEKLCLALNVTPGDLLEIMPQKPKRKRARRKSRAQRLDVGTEF
jgi:DNA-binding Xre family transcriptional regulator